MADALLWLTLPYGTDMLPGPLFQPDIYNISGQCLFTELGAIMQQSLSSLGAGDPTCLLSNTNASGVKAPSGYETAQWIRGKTP
ncbi:hypothetical protein QBL02_00330 [Leucobacter sp. UT-8R-CII-1-4]|uniref:hypothetical protein n=1 Tax=Leucobacter sp. UT-8R-CII-1-4 TaxID=3040075 RepID=UPI0024A8CC8F|nr:hypothetical protein [Leucobacter sp. UT-8R-CII-1-4]MDI6021984.1 hypothetical protein [Leucobacter sp. UT-8R-CII-1-4]